MSKQLAHMWCTQPHFIGEQLIAIPVPIWIVDGDHEQFIKRSHTDYMSSVIPGAYELILPGVSHGAPMQDRRFFNQALLDFLVQDTSEYPAATPLAIRTPASHLAAPLPYFKYGAKGRDTLTLMQFDHTAAQQTLLHFVFVVNDVLSRGD